MKPLDITKSLQKLFHQYLMERYIRVWNQDRLLKAVVRRQAASVSCPSPQEGPAVAADL